jgi:hypothetical protein
VLEKIGKIILGVIATIVGIAVTITLIGLPLFVFPRTDTPTVSDVVFVIGPPEQSRLDIAHKLIDDGLAKNFMISVRETQARWFKDCAASRYNEATVYCAQPEPFTTQGEAEWLKTMALLHHWNSAIVITQTDHISRARMLVERCYSGQLQMVADPKPMQFRDWIYQYAYQTAAYVKAFIFTSC